MAKKFHERNCPLMVWLLTSESDVINLPEAKERIEILSDEDPEMAEEFEAVVENGAGRAFFTDVFTLELVPVN